MSHACHEMDGVGTKRYVPLQPCFKLKYVCQTTPLEGEGEMFTHPFFTMQRPAKKFLITSCTRIILIVGHTMTLSFHQRNKCNESKTIYVDFSMVSN